MRRYLIIPTCMLFLIGPSFGQTQLTVDSLLTTLYTTKNSKYLSTQAEGRRLISYGEKILPFLANRFTDTTLTAIKSECQEFMLTKGEVAIIVADRIEMMPYAQLAYMQNCELEFCKDNPNLVEYYIHAIRRITVKKFQDRYFDWLKSKERRKSHYYLINKKKRTK